MQHTEKIQVYYDGNCHICYREIEYYKRKDKRDGIDFRDINGRHFDPAKEGLDPNSIHRIFHVKTKSGEILVGVDGFIAIWEEIKSLNFLARVARVRLVRFFLEIGYRLFVVARPYLPRKKCETDSCQI